MSETGGYMEEGFSSEEGQRLSEAVNREESKIIFRGDTNPKTLDTYLEAQFKAHQWGAHHPSTSVKDVEAEHHREEALKFRKILDGSYYTEKAKFCREQADRIFYLIDSERTDEMGIKGRQQAARWLKIEASCLEMPAPRPPVAPTEEH
jgi:hypothetical protein